MIETIFTVIFATFPLVMWISIFLSFVAFITGTIIGLAKKKAGIIKLFALIFLYVTSYHFLMVGFWLLGVQFLPRFTPESVWLLVSFGLAITVALAIILLTIQSAKRHKIIFRISNTCQILYIGVVIFLFIFFLADYLKGPVGIYVS